MALIRRIFTSLSVLVIVALCAAWLLFSVPATGWKALVVPTGSMRPSITPGSLVFVHSAPVSSLRVGDVITYNNPLKLNSTITHRIIKKYLLDGRIPSFVTKGDANKTADIPIVGGEVQGRVVWHVPFVGTALGWARTWPGLFALLYTPALLVTIDEIRRLAKYYKLQEPYRLFGFVRGRERMAATGSSSAMAIGVTVVVVVIGASTVIARPAIAMLHSNTVSLTHNSITVAAAVCKDDNGQGDDKNGKDKNEKGNDDQEDNHVSVTDQNEQTSQTSDGSVSGNTNGGDAQSGNASNQNEEHVNVKIEDCD